MRDLAWIQKSNREAIAQARAQRKEALQRVIANAERELKELEEQEVELIGELQAELDEKGCE